MVPTNGADGVEVEEVVEERVRRYKAISGWSSSRKSAA
jgi:hypothetical protein